MKSLTILTLLTLSSLSFGGTIELGSLEAPAALTKVESRYVVDMDKSSAELVIEVTQRVNGPQGMGLPYMKTTILEVPGLMMVGETLVLMTAEGNVDCGIMGKSRVLRVPVLRLTGKCEVQTTLNGKNIDISLNY
jgi:hypothetical protein